METAHQGRTPLCANAVASIEHCSCCSTYYLVTHNLCLALTDSYFRQTHTYLRAMAHLAEREGHSPDARMELRTSVPGLRMRFSPRELEAILDLFEQVGLLREAERLIAGQG